ncbi:sphingosine-1-phosphate phosphatase 2 [Stegastes partitus]|uniref:Sphingosine-1-phosphate phosphatase 2 n=1 Tax=Stegastes partitus TaxID=144197 RepID=A0A9Y4NMX7_9TELE|nr:PREDICTED: sphingosine-1-phosphate phosphatase 2 [Stegastes partitus]
MFCFQDVICGVLISGVILFLTYPYWETFDHFQLNSSLSPVVALGLLLFLSYTYPDLDHYSTTRGDTTTILGSCAGYSVGYWVNNQLGQTFEPQGTLPVPLPTLTANALALGTGRFLVGVVALVGTRQVVKAASLHVLYSWYGVPKSDQSARRRKEIEVPYKFTTYTAVGLVHSILANRIFVLLGLL